MFRERGPHSLTTPFLIPTTTTARAIAKLPSGPVVARTALAPARAGRFGADQIEILSAALQRVGERFLVDGGPGIAATADGTAWFVAGPTRCPCPATAASVLYRIVPGIDGAIRVPVDLTGTGAATTLAAAGRTVWIGRSGGSGAAVITRLAF